MTEMKCLVFEIGSFHLNREVIDAETIVKLGAQLPQQIGLRDAVGVNHVRTQRFAPGSDRPNVQVVHIRNSVSRENRIFNRRQVDMRRGSFQQHVRRLANQPYRAPDDQ